MAAGGADVAPASAQLEAAAAAVAVGVALYHVGSNSAKTVAKLDLRRPVPPATLQMDAGATAFVVGGTDPAQLCRGLYMAIMEGGEILDLARLSFLEGPPVAYKVEATEEQTEGNGKGAPEKEAATVERKEEEEEGKGEGDDSLGKEEEEEEEAEEMWREEGEDRSRVTVKLLPGLSRAVLTMFSRGYWKMTRAYSVKWLKNTEKTMLLDLINKEIDNNGAVTCKTVASSYLAEESKHQLEFEGYLLYSSDSLKLNPDANQFEAQNSLGRGASGQVYQCVYLNAKYALKVIDVTHYFDYLEPREVNIMSCLHDPNVVTFHQAWAGTEMFGSHLNDLDADKCNEIFLGGWGVPLPQQRRYIFIHMELCKSSLKKALSQTGDLTNEEKWLLVQSIAKGVKCLHQNGVIHRDLKPDNVFVGSNNVLKIGDFGNACWAKSYVDGKRGTPGCGTMMYVAPELGRNMVTDKVDIYSIGVMYLEIMLYPYEAVDRFKALYALLNAKYNNDWDVDMEFLKKITSSSPSDRPTIDAVLEYLRNRI